MTLVTCDVEDGIATITLDDGKVNALSPTMLGEIEAALDVAAAAGAVVVLAGRPGVLSGGFDLKVMGAGGAGVVTMLRAGFELSARLLAHPDPVVIAATGHAIAMGSFLLLSADHRIGCDDGATIVANEVAIGMTMPFTAIEICRQRLTPAAFNRAVLLAERFGPQEAVAAGWLDQVVPAADVLSTAHAAAERFKALDRNAHRGSKERLRQTALDAIRPAIKVDIAALESLLG